MINYTKLNKANDITTVTDFHKVTKFRAWSHFRSNLIAAGIQTQKQFKEQFECYFITFLPLDFSFDVIKHFLSLVKSTFFLSDFWGLGKLGVKHCFNEIYYCPEDKKVTVILCFHFRPVQLGLLSTCAMQYK